MDKIRVIGMPMKYGCFVEGADLSYEYLKDSFKKVFGVKGSVVDTFYPNAVVHKTDKKIKYLEPVMKISKRLYKEVYSSFFDNEFPIIVGGDHSTCIGSISAALDYYKGDISVIYIDEHADIHNNKTTPSGNIHGMPLSICIGECDDRFDIGSYKLNPSNLYFIGLGDYEVEEMNYIKEKNISCYMDYEIDEDKVQKIVSDIVGNIKTKYVHISFDLDCIKKEEFSAVNVSVEGLYHNGKGITLNAAKKILNMLFLNLNIVSMDIVEYNPLLDKDYNCKKKVEEIILEIKRSMKL